jgi:glyoxylase-like metal-dependent hydrolase (beta-lactamase superfamily II)
LPDGTAIAIKIADGRRPARPAVLLAGLAAAGVDVAAIAPGFEVAIMGHGHGRYGEGGAAMSIPYVIEHDPRYGESVAVAPLIRRVTARNAGKFSGYGTGTYIVGHGDVVVIDPGPALNSHREALTEALRGERVTRILVTCHSDHSPWPHGCTRRQVRRQCASGPVESLAWVNDDDEPYVPDEEDLAAKAAAEADGLTEEGHDLAFVPDIAITHGALAAEGDGWTITAVHTPGHTSNHTCYHLTQTGDLFSGDHIMGWSTSVITPPDGDMRDYLASLPGPGSAHPATLGRPSGGCVRHAFIEHRLDRSQHHRLCATAGADPHRAAALCGCAREAVPRRWAQRVVAPDQAGAGRPGDVRRHPARREDAVLAHLSSRLDVLIEDAGFREAIQRVFPCLRGAGIDAGRAGDLGSGGPHRATTRRVLYDRERAGLRRGTAEQPQPRGATAESPAGNTPSVVARRGGRPSSLSSSFSDNTSSSCRRNGRALTPSSTIIV